jgi:inhibitor of KinA
MLVNSSLPGKNSCHKVCTYLQELNEQYRPSSIAVEGEIISIPVCYGGALGPDIEYVAEYHRLTVDEVIAVHSSAVYKVHMIGFIPGFAYMGGLNSRLETPRKPVVAKVPAGAVGIAGKQTGIYPLETPGGWQIIGQTPLKLFDARQDPPALLKASDRVKLEQIIFSDFERYDSR